MGLSGNVGGDSHPIQAKNGDCHLFIHRDSPPLAKHRFGGISQKELFMRNMLKFFGIASLAVVAGFLMAGCEIVTDEDTDPKPPSVAVIDVSLNTASLTIGTGKTETLIAAVMPPDATNKSVTWNSSDAAIASVDTGGKITGHATGQATITVTTVDGAKKAYCTVSVVIPVDVSDVSLNETALSLFEGRTEQLFATVEPPDATNKDVTWSSSNNNIATVDANGVVTGVNAATETAIITATTVDGKKTASCTVTVTPKPPSITDANDIVTYLNAQRGGENSEDPVYLGIYLILSDENWKAILNAINTVKKYVELDLTDCRPGSDIIGSPSGLGYYGDFVPGSENTGEKYIVALILPYRATRGIGGGTSSSSAFRYFSNLKNISGSGITAIGSYCFSNCTSLTSVSFPNVTSIDTSAFFGCTGLASVSFPSVTSIDTGAFSGCTGLTSVSFPNAIYILGGANYNYGAFYNCTSLASVSFPKVTAIGSDAFRDCTSLSSIDFPNVASIGYSAFHNCTKLVSVNFPKATDIANPLEGSSTASGAFNGCAGLTSINFPMLTNMGNNAFLGCFGLTSVSFPNVENIGNSAFLGLSGLNSISFPKAVNIGDGAFSGCTGLASADFPNAESIGGAAFGNCTGLTSISFPKAIIIEDDDSLRFGAFGGCTGLTSVIFPNVTKIGSFAFRNCTNLTSVSFPKATSISDGYIYRSGSSYFYYIGAFSDCSKLESISFPELTSIGSCAFRYCASLTEANFPKVVSIGMLAFYNCTGIDSINFPNAESIGSSAFYNCTKLTSVSFPNVTRILNGSDTAVSGSTVYNTGAFSGCTGLISFSFPKIENIGSYAFSDCAKITSVSFSNAKSIGDYAFSGCTDLANISFPVAESIGAGAFGYLTKLSSVSFPNVTTIKDSTATSNTGAFQGCTSLNNVDFSVLSSLGERAFLGCTGLTSVSFPVAENIGGSAFSSCTGLTSIDIPKAASIGNGAFASTGTISLSLVMGNTVPAVGTNMFSGVSNAKIVNVRIPSSASGYGSSPANTTDNNWGNAFRGKGWNGTNYLTGTVNNYINLAIQTY